jgi:hypothetical protein
MNKKIYKNLYQQYLELKKKTTLKAHRIELGDKIEAQYIDLQDLENIDVIKEKLVNCLDFLSDDELIKISEDENIGLMAQEVLRKRRE